MNLFGWAGTPLLAGFNAGAYYPLEVLYLLLPTQAATLAFVTLLQLIFGLGLRKLGRSIGFSNFAVDLIALSAPSVSYFYAQTIHLDMASGIALIPWALVAIYRQSKATTKRESIKNGILLGISYALIVLGGAPEAMLFGGAFIGVYLVGSSIANRVDLRRLALFIGVGSLIAITVAAPQLLPGYFYISSSQRANLPSNYATAGPFYPQMFISLIAPFIFGSPSQLLPNYQGPYTFEETLVYIGVLPLVAAVIAVVSISRSWLSHKRGVAPIVQESKRFDLTPLLIAGVISALLSLGTYTPLESVMLHVPIYNKQRLPSRNILGLEISLLVAAMAGVDAILLHKIRKGSIRAIALGVAIIAVAATVGIYLGGNGALYAFDGAGALNPFGLITAVTLIPPILIVAFALIYRPNIGAKALRLTLAIVVLVDLASFNFFSYATSGFSNSVSTATGALATSFRSLMKREGGRFAIYDPNLYYYFDDVKVGMPNLNTYNQIPSIQGYGSLSLANYEAATGSHQQATFTPSLPTTPLFSLLEGTTILTGVLYFSLPVGSTFVTYGSPTLMATPQGSFATTDSTYLGAPLNVTSIQLTYSYRASSNSKGKFGGWTKLDKTVGVISTNGKKVIAKETATRVDPRSGALIVTYTLPNPTSATEVFADEFVSATNNPDHAIATGVAVETTTKSLFSVSGDLAKTVTPSTFEAGPSYNALTAYLKRDINVPGMVQIRATRSSVQSVPYIFAMNGGSISVLNARTDGPNRLRYQIATTKDTAITISLAYNSGWHGQLTNGAKTIPLPITECHQTLTCLQLPSTADETTTLTLTYAQKGASTGLAIGGGGVVLTALLWSISRKRIKVPK